MGLDVASALFPRGPPGALTLPAQKAHRQRDAGGGPGCSLGGSALPSVIFSGGTQMWQGDLLGAALPLPLSTRVLCPPQACELAVPLPGCSQPETCTVGWFSSFRFYSKVPSSLRTSLASYTEFHRLALHSQHSILPLLLYFYSSNLSASNDIYSYSLI